MGFLMHRLSRKVFLLVLIGVILGGAFLYYQSNLVKIQADDLLASGKPAEAIEMYQKAQKLFPLRIDIPGDIAGAKLILESNTDYESITDFAELQETPALSDLPVVRLAPNEFFVPVFMYHHIRINPMPRDPVWAALNVSPTQLDQQLSYLASHDYHTMTLDELADALNQKTALPKNPIVLTFDDGYRNFYENAYPLLKKYHMKATQFVITQVVGLPAYLTWNQITEMDKSGLIEIGAHTRHHPSLPDLSKKDIIDEIKGSKSDLEKKLHHQINWFAYPYGSYSSFIIQTVKDAGFLGAASTIYGANQSKDNLYLFPRIMIDGRFSIDNIARRIQQ